MGGRFAGWWQKGFERPARARPGGGVAGALQIALRARPLLALGAIPAWGFGHRRCCGHAFRAFWATRHLAAPLIMGYYVGTLGNVLPLPGGIGGVEGGVVGAFLGFGVSGSLAVLCGTRLPATISYWLPTAPRRGGLPTTAAAAARSASGEQTRPERPEAPRTEAGCRALTAKADQWRVPARRALR